MKSTVAYLSSQQYRRDAMAQLASHAGLGLLGCMLLLPVLVGGWLGGQHAVVVGVAVLALVNTGFRHQVALPQGNVDARLVRQERLLQASAACTGLVWSLCNLLLYPLLPMPWSAAHLMALAGAAALAALVLSWVRRMFALAVVPMLGSLALANLLHPLAPGWPLALAALPLLALLLLVAHRQRLHAAALALHQSQQAAAIHAGLAAERDRAETRLDASARFLATLSHELRTPMNGLLGTLSLLDRSPLGQHQRHLLGLARSAGQGLMALLNDALDLSRIDADRLVLRPVVTAPQLLAESAVALFQASAQAKGLKLVLKLVGPVPTGVLVDAQRLRQVLLNLLSNAIKFTDRGRISLALTSASLPQQRVALRWVVQDSGIGIAADELGQLFQPFAQLHGGRDPDGTGLGLSISQHLVRAMGGEIVVHSTLGVGSRFEFTLVLPLASLPAADAGPTVRPAAAQQPVDVAIDMAAAMPGQADAGPPGADLQDAAVVVVGGGRAIPPGQQGQPGLPGLTGQSGDWATLLDDAEADADADSEADARGPSPRSWRVPSATVDLVLPMSAHEPVGTIEPAAPLDLSAPVVPPTMPPTEPSAATDTVANANANANANADRSSVATRADLPLPPAQRLQPLAGRVLVAEENPVSRMLCVEVLRTFGLQVQAVADDAAARRALMEAPVDLLIVDARLPGLQAAALLAAWRAVRRAEAAMPAVVLSDEPEGSLAALDEWQRFAMAGFSGRLVRPCCPETLHAAIEGWLAPVSSPQAQATVD